MVQKISTNHPNNLCLIDAKKKALEKQGQKTAAGGTRTHTLSPASDFESDASASSATAANQLLDYIIIKQIRMQAVFLYFIKSYAFSGSGYSVPKVSTVTFAMI